MFLYYQVKEKQSFFYCRSQFVDKFPTRSGYQSDFGFVVPPL